ncbi:response regulator [Gloeocapsopsis dulcis]|uniref:Transcriptional regulator n=1 Tax=Gloeocapsopsis dulcis AAB1 = 1H9 TaxID=1433147 RepID=A0A6N8FVX5_9CHRO|nr:response regulator [Gloeocapsopsis dulcis]MUL36096.1 transcriptional regulator [Gloeocapsopsis dulcis AAB1 = 1H9]WNN91432.1 response regulator [Gloeocapsopsis dulcis]
MKILIVEDDEFITEALRLVLTQQHYAVETANDGEAAWELIQVFAYDLILLDVKLPRLDGISLCRRLRSRGYQMPILLITGQDSSHDRVVGLDAGADDYLVKPFDRDELVARVRALLRRGDITSAPVLEWGKLRLDPSSCEVTYDRQLIHLTPKEYALLELFLRNSRRVYSCSAILDHLWSFDKTPGEEAVRTQIKGLRQKLKAVGANDLIETVYGIGYRLKPLEAESTLAVEIGKQTQQQTLFAIAGVWHQFKERVSQQVTLLERAIIALLQEKLTDELRATAEYEAHTLAGSLGTFGLGEGSRIAKRIERIFQGNQAIRHETAGHLCQLVTALRQEIQRPEAEVVTTRQEDTSPLLLIIDSDRLLTEELASTARQQGIPTAVANSVITAREAIYRDNPQIVLLDIAISPTIEESLQLIAKLHAQTPSVTVLVYTARDSLGDRLAVAKHGGRYFFQKSTPPAQVIDKVSQVLQSSDRTVAKVMVVDDDPQILATVRSLLEPWGMKVITLADPRCFWETLASAIPDLLILDIKMPHISGIELCQVVRNDPLWGSLPIVFLTAYKDTDAVNQVFGAGADDFVSKPIVGPELVTRIVNRWERIKLLRNLAETDPLTGVSNRQKAIQEFETLLKQGKADDQFLSLAIIRLNSLQQINLRHGYATGDNVLRRIGQLLQQFFHDEAIVCRWAGAEFMVGMYETSRSDGKERLSVVQETLHQEFVADSNEFQLDFIIGFAHCPEDGTDLQSLYLAATTALAPMKLAATSA